MSRVAFVAEIALADSIERQARGNGDAVIPLLAVDRDMRIAEPLQPLIGKLAVAALRLLQAENIRPVLLQEMRDDRHAQPHRIDVPGGNVQPHVGAPFISRLSSWGEAARKLVDMGIPAICRNVMERWTAHLLVRTSGNRLRTRG